jgi:phosphoglycolate phosphatase
MNKTFELLVFDWDGTLMDSEQKILRCFQAAADDVRAVYPGDDAVRNIIGLGLGEAINALFPAESAEKRLALADRYREHFLHLDQTEMPLFPGVLNGLEELQAQGYTLAIATGKARRGLDRVLGRSTLAHLFSISRCADETLSKPHPRMLLEILDHTGIDPNRALMIGDTVYDMQMAARAGMAAIAVSYGAQPRKRLLEEGPLFCADSFDEVRAWLG